MPPLAAPSASLRAKDPAGMPAPAWLPLLCVTFLLVSLLVGCGRSKERHTDDSRLRKIDQLLNAQLPVGTTRGRVQYFLRARGYQLEETADKTSMRALIRQVDLETLQPLAAHATFHFDANDKLTTYELTPAPAPPF